MPTAEAALVAILTTGSPNPVAAIVGNRVYPDVLPQNVTYPAIRYQRISTPRLRVLSTGRSIRARPRFQVDCWALTKAQALAVAEAVRDLLDGFAGTSAGLALDSGAIEDEAGDFEAGPAEGGAGVYRQRLDIFLAHPE